MTDNLEIKRPRGRPPLPPNKRKRPKWFSTDVGTQAMLTELATREGLPESIIVVRCIQYYWRMKDRE